MVAKAHARAVTDDDRTAVVDKIDDAVAKSMHPALHPERRSFIVASRYAPQKPDGTKDSPSRRNRILAAVQAGEPESEARLQGEFMTPKDSPVRIRHSSRVLLIGRLNAEQPRLHNLYRPLDDRHRSNNYSRAQAAESRMSSIQER